MRTYNIPTRQHAATIWFVLTLLKLPVYLWFFAGIQVPAFQDSTVRLVLVAGIVLYEVLWMALSAVGLIQAVRAR